MPKEIADSAPAAEAKTVPAAEANGLVKCTVTKAGVGQIHTGGPPGETYERGAVIHVPAETAASLEARHFVETD